MVKKEPASLLRAKAMYTVEHAVIEIDRAIRLGYDRGNPMSIAKLLELKAKLYGLLVERVETVTVDIALALSEAKRRTAITATVEPLPSLPAPVEVKPAEASARPAWDPFAE